MMKYIALALALATFACTGFQVADPSSLLTGGASRKFGSVIVPQQAGDFWVSNGAKIVGLEQFGAKGDGATNDSAAMTSAVAAISGGGVIQLGCNKTYLIGASSPYTLANNNSIVGCGQTSILSTVTNQPVIVAKAEGVRLAHFKILGNATGASQDGIRSWSGTSGVSDWIAEDVEVNNVGGTGFYIYYGGPVTNVGPQLIACRAIANTTAGFVTGTEYTVGIGNIARGNGRGFEIDAGNVTWTGGAITSNTTGIYQTGGGNDGHGVVSGVLINHNTNAITIGAVGGLANGMVYANNQVFYGAIALTNAHDVRFQNSTIDVDSLTFTTSAGTTFDGDTWANSCCANTITNTSSTTLATGQNLDLTGAPSSVVRGSGWTLNMPTTLRGAFTSGGGGSDFKTVCGPMPSFETADSGCWAVATGTTPSSSNVLVYADGTNGFLNAAGASGVLGFTVQGTYVSKIAPIAGSQFAFWLGNGASFTNNNGALYSDASTFTNVNFPTSAFFGITSNATTYVAQFAGGAQGGITLGANIATVGHLRSPAGFLWQGRNSTNTGNNVVFQDDGANNVNQGSGYNTWTMGANNFNIVAATQIAIEGGTDQYYDSNVHHFRNAAHTESLAMTLGTLQTAFSNGIAWQTITITGNRTLDTTTGDNIVIIDTSSGVVSVTLPTPTNGRCFQLIDKKNTFNTNNLTLVRHAAEKIDNVAASKVVSASGYRAQICSDGTDWYSF